MGITVTEHPDEGRYLAEVDGELAGFVDYRRRPDGLALTHTEVLPAFGGKGVGSALARAVLDDIRAKGERVIPICPFITSFIRRHRDYADLVVDRYQSEVAS